MGAARFLAVGALAAVLAFGGAACGGGDDDAAEATSESAARTPATAPPATEMPEEPGTEPATDAPPAPEPAAPAPLPGLPGYTAGFAGWERLNASPIPPDSEDSRIVGFDAHRSTKNVFVNVPRERLVRPGGGQALPYPDGTILVKAGEEGGTVTLVAIMRKIRGIDPEHGDWQFVEYKRPDEGTPFATEPALRDATCWGCHATVADDDWVFTALDPR